MAKSQNGWSVLTPASPRLKTFKWITGKVRYLYVHKVFNYLCERFNAEVEQINVAWSWGYAARNIRGSSTSISNHASGTSIDLNAPEHPHTHECPRDRRTSHPVSFRAGGSSAPTGWHSNVWRT